MKRKTLTRKNKIICYKALVALVAIAFFASLALCLFGAITTYADRVLTLDVSKRYQTVDGFGASSAWIYQSLGLLKDEEFKNEAMELLYGDDGVSLSVFRYNIGAGGRESDSYGDPLRGAESYFISDRFNGDYSVFKDADNYDFTRDEGVRDLLERALKLGNVKSVVFFANSPHYLMTQNGKTHGENIDVNNLREECYEAFSDYLLVITDWIYKNVIYKYDAGIEVSISPINEPQWDWGGAGASQEGCHYDPKPLARFCDVFYRTVKNYNTANGTEYKADLFESGCCRMRDIKPYIRELARYEWFEDIQSLSVHSYNTELSLYHRRCFDDYMRKNYPNIKVKMTEYCVMRPGVDTGIDTGLYSAKVMLRDFKYMHATEWSYWLSVSNGDYEDGLVYWNKDENGEDILRVTKRFYTFGQFSRFLNGATMIASTFNVIEPRGLEQVAFVLEDGSIALIVINDAEHSRSFKIKNFSGRVTQITTDAEDNQRQTQFDCDGILSVGAKSINTFIL